MTLKNALAGVALCAMVLSLFACVEPGPMPPPSPPPEAEGPPPSEGPPLYFVNVSSLALRTGPTTSSQMITTLHFNEQVALLGTDGGWGRVQVVGRSLSGWAYMRYLQPVPANRPRSVPSRRRSTPKKETPKPASTPKAM